MTALFLRTVSPDFTSHSGFRWPRKVGATVEAPDWDPKPECGNGLHGLMWGEGDGSLLGAIEHPHLVVEADAASAVCLKGKHKFQRCTIRYIGDAAGAADYIIANGGAGRAIARATLTGGDAAKLTGGDWAMLTGGHRATLTGGHRATLTGGDWAMLTGGNRATLTGGDWAMLTGGYGATLTGGDGATLSIKWWNGRRSRIAVAYVGEDGIEPGVAYRLDAEGKFIQA